MYHAAVLMNPIPLVLGAICSVAILSTPILAAGMCEQTIEVTNNGQPANDFIGRIVELYEDEGGGDPSRHRHLYLFLPETICLVSKNEDRAAALNIIQLYPINKIPNALLKASVVTIKGRLIAVHVGHYFGTPYAIEVMKATKE
jgi:hypothetical protein